MRITIDKGLRFPRLAEPLPLTVPHVRSVAVHGDDCRGLRPEILVARGDRVSAGQALFRDRRQPGIQVVSPVDGTVREVRIGPRRALQAIVVEPGAQPERSVRLAEAAGGPGAIANMPINALRERLHSSGLWAAIRERPGDRVPPADGLANAVLITALDTEPYAPPVEVVLEGQWDEFRAGVLALSRFSQGATWVCAAPGVPFDEDRGHGIRVALFEGPHPAGLPGTHINRLAPLHAGRTAWHIGCQDVAAIGHLLLSGRLRLLRLIGVGGPGAGEPSLARVPLGASVPDIAAGIALDHAPYARDVISGSLLSGRRAEPPFEHLGRFHRQVTVTSNKPPGLAARSGTPRLLARLLTETPPSNRPRAPAGGMLPGDGMDRLWALDGPSAPLLRALLIHDLEAAVALGCLDLGEEDLALPALACAGGLDYGACLRDALEAFEREQAR